MNGNVTCPDCKSTDLQKIERNEDVLTVGSRRNLIIRCMIGCGLLFLTIGFLTNTFGMALFGGLIIGPFFVGIPLGLLLCIFYKKFKAKTMVYVYYACRVCGREFQN